MDSYHENAALAAENFFSLTPDHVLEGVEAAGFVPTGQYYQLNSYENRVFDIQLEEGLNPPELRGRVIVKFYRPHRWTQLAIEDEHEFLLDLKSQGIPAIAPLIQASGTTLSVYNHMYLALFPKAFGRMPQELSAEDLHQVGRRLAHIHNLGGLKKALHRPTLTVDDYGWSALDILGDWVAPEVWERYEHAAETILDHLEQSLDPQSYIRIHGDCHKGNLLKTDIRGQAQEFFFVDFDDFCNGPPVQDFWMLLSEGGSMGRQELDEILSGYEELREIDRSQLSLIDPLRGLRIIHYGAWIARRWEDPSFPMLFPQYQSYSYWAEETEALEKIAWSL